MASTDPIIGKRLGDYAIQDLLGTGGMARVYRGYDERLDRYAAVKVIEPHLIASADEPEYRERFLREARAIARLSHPNIVGVYQFGQLDNLYYIAMEYVEGLNLREMLKTRLKSNELMPIKQVISILRDIASALDYAHERNIIHRDVKPSNIIVTENKGGVLTDFGLALNAMEGTIGNTFGSVHYIAPEQAISSAQAVPQSDQYSLAIVAYEMLTGRVPFDDASAMSVALKHISDMPPSLAVINPNVPSGVEVIVLKALDKDFNRRFETCRDFVAALEGAFMTTDSLAAKPRRLDIPLPAPVLANDLESPTLTDAKRVYQEMRSAVSGETVSAPPARNSSLVIVAVLMLAVAALGLLLLQANGHNAEATATAVAVALDQSERQTAIAATLDAELELTNQARAILTVEGITQRAATRQTATAEAQALATQRSEQATQTHEAQPSITNTARPTRTPSLNATDAPAVSVVTEATQETTEAVITEEALAEEATQKATATFTATNTATFTPTFTATNTATFTPTFTATNTATFTPTFTPTPTPTPDLVLDEGETQNVLLRYDGRTIVMINLGERTVTISNLQFTLYEASAEGETPASTDKTFVGSEWNRAGDGLASMRCFQLWTANYRNLPANEPPADACAARTSFRQTTRPFWISEAPHAYFEVRRGERDVIAICPINEPETFNELRCAFRLAR